MMIKQAKALVKYIQRDCIRIKPAYMSKKGGPKRPKGPPAKPSGKQKEKRDLECGGLPPLCGSRACPRLRGRTMNEAKNIASRETLSCAKTRNQGSAAKTAASRRAPEQRVASPKNPF
jgi:hypothetical protein